MGDTIVCHAGRAKPAAALPGSGPATPPGRSPEGRTWQNRAITLTYTRRDPVLTNAGYAYEYSTTLEDAGWQPVTPAGDDATAAGPGAGNQTVTGP